MEGVSKISIQVVEIATFAIRCLLLGAGMLPVFVTICDYRRRNGYALSTVDCLAQLVGDTSSDRLSSLLEVVRLTYEEGVELGGVLAASHGEEIGAKLLSAANLSLDLRTPKEEPASNFAQYAAQERHIQQQEQESYLSDENEQVSEDRVQGWEAKQAKREHDPKHCEFTPAEVQTQEAWPHQQRLRGREELQAENASWHQSQQPQADQREAHLFAQIERFHEGPSAIPPRPPSGGVPAGGKLLTGGPCESCGCTESPQWRRPDPARMVMCNRCGIHYGRYKKLPGKKQISYSLMPDGTAGSFTAMSAPPTSVPGPVNLKRKSANAPSYTAYEQQSQQVPRASTIMPTFASGPSILDNLDSSAIVLPNLPPLSNGTAKKIALQRKLKLLYSTQDKATGADQVTATGHQGPDSTTSADVSPAQTLYYEASNKHHHPAPQAQHALQSPPQYSCYPSIHAAPVASPTGHASDDQEKSLHNDVAHLPLKAHMAGGQAPYSQQQRFIVQNGMLLTLEGNPVDPAVYNKMVHLLSMFQVYDIIVIIFRLGHND
eukprot:gene3444-13502_t